MKNNRRKKHKNKCCENQHENSQQKSDDNNSVVNNQSSSDKKEESPSIYREAFLLIVSLLHGSIFFILADKVIPIIKDFSLLKLSFLLFFFSLFFRIFQTHSLAAISYAGKWKFHPFDFMLVFVTALFEYVLFSLDESTLSKEPIYFHLVCGFALFGIVGYFFTYLKARGKQFPDEQKGEFYIQAINMSCLSVMGVLQELVFDNVIPKEPCYISCVNIVSSLILFANIWSSVHLSKNHLG